MLILGIETSCDETAAAIVEDGRKLISNIVVSQIEKHKKWGGVIPEMASRFHLEAMTSVIEACLLEASIRLGLSQTELISKLDAIAVTEGPGLSGSLLVGINAAKTLAWLYDKKLILVNHLHGHIAANYISTELEPPLICLLVSGGHTQIIRVDSYTDIQIIGETLDDAAGEAFDKVARLMGLPYPGGPHLDKLASSLSSSKYSFKIPKVAALDFSFSGLKTAALQLKEKLGDELWFQDKAEIAYAFQETIAEFLAQKLLESLKLYDYNKIIIAGGVAANSAIRRRFSETFSAPLQLYYPPLALCTDNAAMIAAAAYMQSCTKTALA